MLIVLPVLSAMLTALAFGGKTYSWLVFFALVPLLLCTHFSNAAPQIALFSFAYHLILLLWLYRLEQVASFLQMAAAILAISSAMALIYALPFWLFRCSSSLEWILLWLLTEFFACSLGIFSFPWGRLGVILAPLPRQIQIASIFGTLGVTFFILCVNMLLFIAIRRKKPQLLLAAGLLLCINYLYGSVVIMGYSNGGQPGAQVGILQGGIGSLEKWQEDIGRTAEQYLALAQRAADQGATIILFPETALPTVLGENELTESFAQLARNENVELLLGGFTACGTQQYNSLLYLPDGSRYHKRTLVPFGEFIPFAGSNLLLPGKGDTTLDTRNGRAGILICYDSIFPALMRKSVQDGAEFLILSTNDSWFSGTPALYQHQAHAVLRAVESRRYLLRSAATGISCVIRPTGEIVSSLPLGAPGVLLDSVSRNDSLTLYVRAGDWIPWLLLGFFLYKKISPYRG